MDDAELKYEVLELTLACQRGDVTAEERERLERLLSDHPQAIRWYLQVVDDTLTLCDAAAARSSASSTEASAGCSGDSCSDTSTSLVETRSAVFRISDRRRFRSWLAIGSVAGMIVLAVSSIWLRSTFTRSDLPQDNAAQRDSARIVEIANVVWADGAEAYNEWALVRPGQSLRLQSGWLNLFLANGAELLIEGPADVKYVSPQRVLARRGKLAARIGPEAVGFRIDTPHAQVIDRGTAFGVSVNGDTHTSVVVYEGTVDLDVLGDRAQPLRRLATGEALSIDGKGQLSRITTVESAEFLEPPQVRMLGAQPSRLIARVSDNVRTLSTAKYYRVMPRGFREDCRAYVDRLHEWNGTDQRGLPPFLLDGDYVMMFNDDKIVSEIEIAVTLSQPANLFVLIDDRVKPPDWLKRDFVDTNCDVGSDDGWSVGDINVAVGAGQSVDHVFSVWRRTVTEPSTVILGTLSHDSPPPAMTVERSMYGIVVTPLRGEAVQPMN
jgi:hypothetical protein